MRRYYGPVRTASPEEARRLDAILRDMARQSEEAERAGRKERGNSAPRGGTRRHHRTAVCHTCCDDLDSRFDPTCPRCGWIECPQCGGCGCN